MASGDRVTAPVRHQLEHDDDEDAGQRGYIRGTDYALPYTSPWSRMHHEDAALLRQLNCSFLSTPETPPTLLALKQHAQALCVLLARLVPNLRPTEVDAANTDPDHRAEALRAAPNDAFDWLDDLRTPYANDDPDHQRPLNSLLNEVRSRGDVDGTEYHCPLTKMGASPPGGGEADSSAAPASASHRRPFAHTHNLIRHTNECLERLDHEFSSEGGLMGLLPTDAPAEMDEAEAADREGARESLLGQWLAFTQRLVARMHELEIAYGNALDALAGEAVVPLLQLQQRQQQPQQQGPRTAYYPQDKWLLVNAGEEVFARVHDMLDRREALQQEREGAWRHEGLSGSRMWTTATATGEENARGIVAVDLVTRYYRIAGLGGGDGGDGGARTPLFVVPAWSHHPGVSHTRTLEQHPTVVSVLQPKYPLRPSELEKKYDARVARAEGLETKFAELATEVGRARVRAATLAADVERERAANRALEKALGVEGAALASEAARLKRELQSARQAWKSAADGREESIGEMTRLQLEVDEYRRDVHERDRRIADLEAQLAETHRS